MVQVLSYNAVVDESELLAYLANKVRTYIVVESMAHLGF